MFLAALLERINAYARYRNTMRELSKLSDRELDDLGISRWEIAAVARRWSHA